MLFVNEPKSVIPILNFLAINSLIFYCLQRYNFYLSKNKGQNKQSSYFTPKNNKIKKNARNKDI